MLLSFIVQQKLLLPEGLLQGSSQGHGSVRPAQMNGGVGDGDRLPCARTGAQEVMESSAQASVLISARWTGRSPGSVCPLSV